MEVTYWDQKKSIENAREWGHIHLDEVIERLHEFEGEKLVFVHASERYSLRDLRETLRKRIPQDFKDKVEVFAAQPKV